MRYFLMFVVAMTLSLSFSTVSNAEVFDDPAPQENPLSDEDSPGDEPILEVEVNETFPMIQEVPFRISLKTSLSKIADNSPFFFDSYTVSIEIPPLA